MWWLYYHTRRFFRSIMPPIPGNVAQKWHRRMQFLYILSAGNFALYIWYNSRSKPDKERLTGEAKYRRMAQNFGYDNVTAYHFKNGSLQKYEIDLKENAAK